MDQPIAAYKEFIDSFVEIRPSVHSRWVKESDFGDLHENAHFNHLLVELTPEQREVLAELLQRSRDSGIHDALVQLDGYTLISPDGVSLPRKPFGYFMHYDWVLRREGEQWDEEDDFEDEDAV